MRDTKNTVAEFPHIKNLVRDSRDHDFLFKKGKTKRIWYHGFVHCKGHWVFACPCGDITKYDHSECRSLFTATQFHNTCKKIGVTLLKIQRYLLLPCFHVFAVESTCTCSPPPKRISNYQINVHLNIPTAYQYFSESYGVYIYQKHLNIMFKHKSINQLLYYNSLTCNNVSSLGVDRSNINFRHSYNELLSSYHNNNLYYLKLSNSNLQNDIKSYYQSNGKYKDTARDL